MRPFIIWCFNVAANKCILCCFAFIRIYICTSIARADGVARAARAKAVEASKTHLQDFVANLEPSIFVGTPFWMHAADEDAHLGSVPVSGEADASAS